MSSRVLQDTCYKLLNIYFKVHYTAIRLIIGDSGLKRSTLLYAAISFSEDLATLMFRMQKAAV
jgi:ABC-type iron transport system FetAB ATPase subunit